MTDKYLALTTGADRHPGHSIRPSHAWSQYTEFPWNWHSKVLNMHIIRYAIDNEYSIGVTMHFNVFNHLIDMDMRGIYGTTMQQWIV